VLVLWNYTDLSANAEVPEPPPGVIDELCTLLEARGYQVRAFNAEDNCDRAGDSVILFRPDVVLNLIDHFHGDTLMAAAVSGLLEIFEYPAVGADSLAIAACSDRLRTHLVLRDAAVPCTGFIPVWDADELPDTSALRFPVILCQSFDDIYHRPAERPVLATVDELAEHAAEILPEYELPFMIEEMISGRRLTALVLGDEVLGPVELTTSDDGVLLGELAEFDDPEVITEIAWRASRVTNCRDWAQIDLVVTEGGQALVTDVRPCVSLWNADSPFRRAAATHAEGIGGVISAAIESALARARRQAALGED
jgi:D-alanine-D-alanine ligase-like ATP-grasp enzyme